MSKHNHSASNRRARRAQAAQRRAAGKAKPSLPISHDELEAIGARATQVVQDFTMAQLGVGRMDPARVVLAGSELPDGTSLVSASRAGAVLIPFVAARYLADRGLSARIVAGAAIWAVGQGDQDTLDHGLACSGGPAWDAAHGHYHVWLDLAGHLVDPSARLLPMKFADAAQAAPFSTPQHLWRRFPDTIIHPRGRPMSNPLEDFDAAYGYWEKPHALIHAVMDHLAPTLSRVEAARQAAPTP